MFGFILGLILILVILYLLGLFKIELFSSLSNSEPKELLVFVSKTCPHCVSYNANLHDGVVALAKSNGVEVKRIFSDNDSEGLFDKYNVMYVPTGILLKGGKVYKNLGSNLDPETIKQSIQD